FYADANAVESVMEACKKFEIGLVIVDTLSRAIAPGSDSKPEDMGAFIRACDRIRAETSAAVLVIHHTGKDRERGARGSSTLLGGIDLEIFADGKGEQSKTLTVTKNRAGPDGMTYGFELKVVETGRVDEDGEPEKTCIVAEVSDVAKPRNSVPRVKPNAGER